MGLIKQPKGSRVYRKVRTLALVCVFESSTAARHEDPALGSIALSNPLQGARFTPCELRLSWMMLVLFGFHKQNISRQKA